LEKLRKNKRKRQDGLGNLKEVESKTNAMEDRYLTLRMKLKILSGISDITTLHIVKCEGVFDMKLNALGKATKRPSISLILLKRSGTHCSMKMYVLVRKDLNKAQQAVQGGHALAQFLLNHQSSWENGTLIYLGVKGERQLMNWIRKLEWEQIDTAVWREPDMASEITAVAAYSEENIFKSLNCL
jgi:hypothetical protein